MLRGTTGYLRERGGEQRSQNGVGGRERSPRQHAAEKKKTRGGGKKGPARHP